MMEEAGCFSMDDPSHKFCISWVTLKVSQVGTRLVVESWNNHHIPGYIIII